LNKTKEHMAKTQVFCIAKGRSQAEQIVERLQAEGFPSSEISILVPDKEGKHEIGPVKATKAPEGATAGVTSGGITGGVIGLLAGIGALAIPGVGPLIAAGPIMGALSGAAVGGATGGIIGALVGLGIPEVEARRYEDRLKAGNYLIAVHARNDTEEDRATEIFKNADAEDITSSSMSSVSREESLRA
jgi:uncharacterized membrane protein